MEEGKSALSSVSIWGSIIAFAGGALQIVSDPTVSAFIPPKWNPYIVLVGALTAAIGRVKAKSQITSVVSKSE